MINILQLVTGLGPGGAEKVIFDICRKIDKTKFNCTVCSISEIVTLLPKFEASNIPTTPLFTKKNPVSFIKSVSILNRHIKKNNIHVIHAHMAHPVYFAVILKILNPSLKIIFTPHNINVGGWHREFILWLCRPFRHTDILFSKEIVKFFYIKNIITMGNGINTIEYKKNIQKDSIFTFINIGRMDKVKNHEFIIEAAETLKNKGYNFKVNIVGEGNLMDTLKDKIKKLNLEKYVFLLGFRKDIPILCNQAHAFIMPSLWEGLPISLLEAGASGLPVITTPVGSIPSVITPENGYLASLKDFVNKMEYVYNNYEEAKAKGEQLRIDIKEKFDLGNIVKTHENLYQKATKD